MLGRRLGKTVFTAGIVTLDIFDKDRRKQTALLRNPMKISIIVKLFLAVLAVCSAVMLMQAIAMRVSVQHGFFGYLNDQGRQSMEEALPRVAATYREHGGWDYLRNNIPRWVEVIRPPMASNIDMPLSTADQTGAGLRMGLLDTNLAQIVGNPMVGADSIRIPVTVEGQTVGWIAMVPFEQALAPGEARFLSEQLRMLWIIVIASVLLAALFTYPVTRTILRRVRSLAHATRALAAGNYSSRIDPGPRDELGSLAQDFNHMAQALEHNERARRTFMANISHELRTPLAVIHAEVEALQDGINPPTAESFSVIHQQAGQLGKLINDLHDLSLTDIGGQAYRRVPIDLPSVLKTAATSMQRRFESAGMQLHMAIEEGPLLVLGDEMRLQQLFANLLENSLRYSDAGGEVHIRCSGHAGAIHIHIEDGPPGVAQDKLEHLFKRFYRVETSRNRASGGSGLGLAICRNIVEAHAGRITAAKSKLGGVDIFIELPMAI